MQLQGISGDEVTYACILKACGALALQTRAMRYISMLRGNLGFSEKANLLEMH